LKVLKIDNKWSIEYDPEDNDRPGRLLRYGQDACVNISNQQLNYVSAMFYELLELKVKSNDTTT